ncbi:MAG: hypothetical protein H6832_17715 [Planctomycetes bacterium]|nr:hypothetical protein [Planctomycetota bacterium]
MLFRTWLAFLASILLATVMHTHHVCSDCLRSEMVGGGTAVATTAPSSARFALRGSHTTNKHECTGLCELTPEPSRAAHDGCSSVASCDGPVAHLEPIRILTRRSLTHGSELRIRPPPTTDRRITAPHHYDRGRLLLQ